MDAIFWIGGSPCAGKSSVSDLLAQHYGLHLYQVDFALRDQLDRIDPIRHPSLSGWLAASCDQRWLKPVDDLVADAIGCYRDHFSLIAEDLSSLHEKTGRSGTQPILVEGTALLPALLSAESVLPDHAIWMAPTAAFQLEHYRRRPWISEMLSDCLDTVRAFDNWMQRDIRFAQWVAEEAADHGYTVMWVDGSQSIESNAAQLARHFGFEERL